MDSAATVLMSGSKQNPRDGHRGKFRVWRRTGDLSQWQERFSASGTVDWHSIGWSASMSRDGQQIITGSWAAYEASVWSGNSDSSSWQVIDTLTRHDCCTGGQFGHGGGMSLSGDGNVAAVPGIYHHRQGDIKGYVWTFHRTPGTNDWVQHVASGGQYETTFYGETTWQEFGTSTALSYDGTVIAIGGPKKSTRHVLVSKWTGSAWTQVCKIYGNCYGMSGGNDWCQRFGETVAMNYDGTVVAIGARVEWNTRDNEFANAKGLVDVYEVDVAGASCSRRGSNNPTMHSQHARDGFAYHIAMDDSGDRIAVAAANELRDITDNLGVYLYEWNAVSSVYQLALNNKAAFHSQCCHSTAGWRDGVYRVSLNGDGSVLAVADSGAYEANDGGEVRIYEIEAPASPPG